ATNTPEAPAALQSPPAETEADAIFTTVPQSASDFLARGMAHSARGRRAEALADFTAAIERDPTLAEAYFQRGILNFERNVALSLADFNTAVTLAPDRADYIHWRGRAHSWTDNHEAALADYTRAIELAPE
ncbi:MAG: hypothetical protein CUN49_17335, partial [Candidatus Thermofonsia Clade 1 bacterium]